ncbi:MAG: hypothetical protein ABL994_20625 [Verrucomicrobiales bacterium]
MAAVSTAEEETAEETAGASAPRRSSRSKVPSVRAVEAALERTDGKRPREKKDKGEGDEEDQAIDVDQDPVSREELLAILRDLHVAGPAVPVALASPAVSPAAKGVPTAAGAVAGVALPGVRSGPGPERAKPWSAAVREDAAKPGSIWRVLGLVRTGPPPDLQMSRAALRAIGTWDDLDPRRPEPARPTVGGLDGGLGETSPAERLAREFAFSDEQQANHHLPSVTVHKYSGQHRTDDDHL